MVDSGITQRSLPAPLPRLLPGTAAGPAFATALRGYDRTQVDDHLARVQSEADSLRRELAESETRRQRAEQQATTAERELRSARSTPAAAPSEDSFGYRAEKILRLAEQEAADIRSVTARDSAVVVEQARAQAEKYRHEAEQALIARSALLDQQAAQRTADLLDREQQVEAQLEAARAEAAALQEAARTAAEAHRRQADADADAARERASLDAARIRDRAAKEVERLGALQRGTHSELARLVELLGSELRSRPADADDAGARPSAEASASDQR